MRLCLLLKAVKGGEMKVSENFRVLRFRVCLFVCTLENTNSLSLLKEILSTYTERKKIHECSSRGEGKKDEDKERKE